MISDGCTEKRQTQKQSRRRINRAAFGSAYRAAAPPGAEQSRRDFSVLGKKLMQGRVPSDTATVAEAQVSVEKSAIQSTPYGAMNKQGWRNIKS